MARQRLTLEARRDALLDTASTLFATRPFDEVLMEDVAERAGISRALLYRHFPSKRDLFAAIYQRAADRLLEATELDPDVALAEQVTAGLDAHIDYFAANRHTVLAANRTLAGDPVIQAIISEELAVLRRRLLDHLGVGGQRREVLSSVLMSWLVFVRTLSVEWLANQKFSRAELREICIGALGGALAALGLPVDHPSRPAGRRAAGPPPSAETSGRGATSTGHEGGAAAVSGRRGRAGSR